MIKAYRFSIMLCMFFLLAGCGFIPMPQSGFFDKRLSPDEVLGNARIAMNSIVGYHILSRGEINQTIEQAGEIRNERFSIEFDQKFNNQPPALHSISKQYRPDGRVTTSELYVVNGVAYNRVGTRWIQTTQPSNNIVLSQNPTDLIRFASQANGQGITMEKERGAYRLTLDQAAGKGFIAQYLSEARQSLNTQGIYVNEQDFNILNFEQYILIDDETFKFKKMRTDLIYTVHFNGQTLKTESRIQVDSQGDYNNRIEIPNEVLNSLAY